MKIIKKIWNFIWTTFLMIGCLWLMMISMFSVNYYRNNHNEILKSNDFKKVENQKNIYYTQNIKISDYEIYLENTIQKLPNNLKKVIEDDWIIIIADEVFKTKQTNDFDFIESYKKQKEAVGEFEIGGQTDPTGKVITIYTKEEWSEKMFMVTLLHEIGHAISFEYGWLDKQDEFVSLGKKYRGQFVPNNKQEFSEYTNSTNSELFASAFADYILETEKLKENQKELYFYMENLKTFPKKMHFLNKLRFGWNAFCVIKK